MALLLGSRCSDRVARRSLMTAGGRTGTSADPQECERMELKSDFEVSVGVDRAWEVLTDPQLIAPCLPGARLDEVEGDEFRGAVKVKVGPISAEYRGKATMVETNRDDLRIVIRAEGRDSRGAGNAAADITALMEASSDASTKVEVTTDLKISGKVAQFGRGVL
ncbi:MAG: hypothetical protein F4Z22_06795, partial [Acidimicrobiia bacterium]|nr:hypothetical protein [Acidimicrobiia bacterium]